MSIRRTDHISINRGGTPTQANSGTYHVSSVEELLALLDPATGTTAPTTAPTPTQSNFYVDTSSSPYSLYWWDGTAWNPVGGGSAGALFTFNADPPSAAPAAGAPKMWVETPAENDAEILHIWNGTEWLAVVGPLATTDDPGAVYVATRLEAATNSAQIDLDDFSLINKTVTTQTAKAAAFKTAMELSVSHLRGAIDTVAPASPGAYDIWLDLNAGRTKFYMDGQWIVFDSQPRSTIIDTQNKRIFQRRFDSAGVGVTAPHDNFSAWREHPFTGHSYWLWTDFPNSSGPYGFNTSGYQLAPGGVLPTNATLILRCKTAEAGFNPGEMIRLPMPYIDPTDSSKGIVPSEEVYDETLPVYNIRFPAPSSMPQFPQKTNGYGVTYFAPTPANWEWCVVFT